MDKLMRKFVDKGVFLFIPLVLIMIYILFPFYWTIVTSLKLEGDIVKTPIKYLPNPATLENFVTAWKNVGFYKYFINSLIVSISVVCIVVLCSMLVGYSMSRFKFKGKNAFLLLLLCTQFMPGAMLLIPLFMIFKNLGLINNYLSLILTYATFQIPFNSIMMRGFIANIPIALEEAAMIDGCSRTKAIFKVVLPILMPGIVAAGAFAFIAAWKEFEFALMLTTNNNRFTIPVGLSYMMGQFDINYGALAAGSVIAVLPAIAIFAYVQKYLVQGLGAGAVKG